VASSARDTSAIVGGYDTTIEISSGKPLSELTVVEVSRLLGSIEFDEYKAVFVKNKIDGKCLMKCNTIEDVVNMGITIFVKASLLLDEIKKWKAAGVPMEYFTAANQDISIDKVKSSVDDNAGVADSPVIQQDAVDMNDNDQNDDDDGNNVSEVDDDDTSTTQPVVIDGFLEER